MQKESKPKSNKKVKLLILIVIIALIGIIVVSLLVRNIIITRNAEEENYEKSETLTADNIKEGITIGGVTGTLADPDTSDADAGEYDILSGYKGYVDGELVQGKYEALRGETTTSNSQYFSFKCDFEPTNIIILYSQYSTNWLATNECVNGTLVTYWASERVGYVSTNAYVKSNEYHIGKKDYKLNGNLTDYLTYSDSTKEVRVRSIDYPWATGKNYTYFAFK